MAIRMAYSLGAFAASFSCLRMASTLAPSFLRSSRDNVGAVEEYPSSAGSSEIGPRRHRVMGTY